MGPDDIIVGAHWSEMGGGNSIGYSAHRILVLLLVSFGRFKFFTNRDYRLAKGATFAIAT